MTPRLRGLMGGLLALGLLGGCRLVEAPAKGHLPLRAARPSSGSVPLEVFFAKAPVADLAGQVSMWDQVDEQQTPSALRRQLAENGFRVGVLGDPLPAQFTRLLQLTDEAQRPEQGGASLEAEPRVTMRRLHNPLGARSEIVASSAYDRLPLLVRENGQLRGRTYYKAEAKLAVSTHRESGNRVRLEIVPELEHGDTQAHWTGNEGVLRLDSGRPKEVFDNLKITVDLAPGQFVLLTAMPQREGSIGHYFFTRSSSGIMLQEFIAIRLADSATKDLFADEVNAPPDGIEHN